jgi:hypothetical protein
MSGWTPVKEKDRVGVAIYNYLVSIKSHERPVNYYYLQLFFP